MVVAVGLDEFGFGLVEVLCSPSGPIDVGSQGGGAPADFEAVPGVSEDSSGRCDSVLQIVEKSLHSEAPIDVFLSPSDSLLF